MNIITISHTGARHASQFTANCIVFEAKSDMAGFVAVKVEANGEYKTFAIYLNGDRVTATTNYPKAIGLALLKLTE
jgi:hypothetical protein